MNTKEINDLMNQSQQTIEMINSLDKDIKKNELIVRCCIAFEIGIIGTIAFHVLKNRFFQIKTKKPG